MKKHLPTIMLIVVFMVGLGLLLYPKVSDYINTLHQSRAIASYDESLASLPDADYSDIWESAHAYNARVFADEDRLLFTDEEEADYLSQLDVLGNGIMGYIEISSINVKLALYHGTSEEVLQVGVGHLSNTSLPVGGESTHCVLSGHRGLPSAKLFTDLDQLVVGDIFLLHVLDEVLAYQVDNISIVEPTDIAVLDITEGKDYCTLVTCTPYGINSHRLLIRGVRVDYTEEIINTIQITSDAKKIDPTLVAPAVAVPILIGLLIWLLLSTRKKKDRPEPEKEKTE